MMSTCSIPPSRDVPWTVIGPDGFPVGLVVVERTWFAARERARILTGRDDVDAFTAEDA